MAKRQVRIEVIVDEKNVPNVTKRLRELNAETVGVSNAQNKLKRNLEGVAQRANNQGKDFARLSQGMGGLVKAYATVAANVFALSSVFRLLQRSADFDSMTKSAENLSAVTGRDFSALSRTLQEASGGAINLAQSLEIANKAAATGLDNARIEQLTVLATKAAQTFGGTTTDSINRFTDAILRGRTELVAKTGVVIRMDTALQQYADKLGIGVKNLTDFERKQAVANAIIQEGQRVLGDVEIDPNPYETLVRTFQDLGFAGLNIIRNIFDPLADYLKQSQVAVVALVAAISAGILRKAIPALGDWGDASVRAADQAVQSAKLAMLSAEEQTQNLEAQAAKRQATVSREYAAMIKEQVQFLAQSESNSKAARLARDSMLIPDGQDIDVITKQLEKAIAGQTRGIDRAILNLSQTQREGILNNIRILQKQSAVELEKIEQKTIETSAAIQRAVTGPLASSRQVFNEVRFAGVSGFRNINSAMQETTGVFASLIAGAKAFKSTMRIARAEAEGIPRALAATSAAVGGGFAFIFQAGRSLLSVFSKVSLVIALVSPLVQFLIKKFKEKGEVIDSLTKKLGENERAYESLNKTANNFLTFNERISDLEPFEQSIRQIGFLANALEELQTAVERTDEVISQTTRTWFSGDEVNNVIALRTRLSEVRAEQFKLVQESVGTRDITQVERLRREAELLQEQLSELNRPSADVVSGIISGRVQELLSFRDLTQEAGIDVGNDIINNILKDMEDSPEKDKLGQILLDAITSPLTGDALTKKLTSELEGSAISGRWIRRVNEEFTQTLLTGFNALGVQISERSNDVIGLNRNFQDLRGATQRFNDELRRIDEAGVQNKALLDVFSSFERQVGEARKSAKSLGKDVLDALTQELPAALRNSDFFSDIETNLKLTLQRDPSSDELIAEYERKFGELAETFRDIGRITQQLEIDSNISGVRKELLELQVRSVQSLQEERTLLTQIQAQEEKRVQSQIRVNEAQIRRLKAERSAQGGLDNRVLDSQIAELQERQRLLNAELTVLRSGYDLIRQQNSAQERRNDLIRNEQNLLVQIAEATRDGLDADLQSVESIVEVNKLRERQAKLEVELTATRVRGLALLRGESDEAERAYRNAVLELQLSEARFDALRRNNNEELIRSERALQGIERERERLSILRQTVEEGRNLNANFTDLAKIETDSTKIAIQKLRLEKATVMENIKQLQIKAQIGAIEQAQADRLITTEQQRLRLIDAQNESLDHQLELAKAIEFDRTGDGGLVGLLAGDPQAFSALGQLIGREVRQILADIKGPLENISIGLVKTADSLIVELSRGIVEGGKTLRNMVEALKLGLREMLVNLVADTMRDVFFNMVLNRESESQEERAARAATRETPLAINRVRETTVELNNKAERQIQAQTTTNNLLRQMIRCSCSDDAGELLDEISVKEFKDFSKIFDKGNDKVVDTLLQQSGILEGGFGGLLNTIGSFVSSIFGGGGGLGGLLSSFLPFANGGVVKGITPFASGGVVDSPTLAMVGEGRNNEAIVPLPNNRDIPVKFVGSEQPTSQNVTIEQNFDFRNADSSAINQLRAEAKNIEDRTISRIFAEINKGGTFAKQVGRRGRG